VEDGKGNGTVGRREGREVKRDEKE